MSVVGPIVGDHLTALPERLGATRGSLAGVCCAVEAASHPFRRHVSSASLAEARVVM